MTPIWFNLSDRGRIRVTGEDRARLLHAMTTNHVQQLQPGEGLYAFFLNPQGQILADSYVLCFDDHLLLDTEAATRQSLYEHLDRFIIADDVTLEDVTDQTFCLAVEGDAQTEIPKPNHACAHVRWGACSVAAISFTGLPGLRVYGPLPDKDQTIQTIEAAGVVAVSIEAAEQQRIMHFVPRYGHDITERTLTQEAQQPRAMHYQKGCYLGQEIVERVRSRGHINKLLMGFHGAGDHAPAAGSPVMYSGKEEGTVTSSTFAAGVFYGIASVRAVAAQPGSMVEIEGSAATLVPPNP